MSKELNTTVEATLSTTTELKRMKAQIKELHREQPHHHRQSGSTASRASIEEISPYFDDVMREFRRLYINLRRRSRSVSPAQNQQARPNNSGN